MIANIANGIDVGHAGLQPLIGDDRTVVFQLNTDLFKPHPVGFGLPAGGEHDGINGLMTTTGQCQGQRSVLVLFNRGDVAVQFKIDALFNDFLGQMVADIVIKPAQDLIAAVILRDL